MVPPRLRHHEFTERTRTVSWLSHVTGACGAAAERCLARRGYQTHPGHWLAQTSQSKTSACPHHLQGSTFSVSPSPSPVLASGRWPTQDQPSVYPPPNPPGLTKNTDLPGAHLRHPRTVDHGEHWCSGAPKEHQRGHHRRESRLAWGPRRTKKEMKGCSQKLHWSSLGTTGGSCCVFCVTCMLIEVVGIYRERAEGGGGWGTNAVLSARVGWQPQCSPMQCIYPGGSNLQQASDAGHSHDCEVRRVLSTTTHMGNARIALRAKGRGGGGVRITIPAPSALDNVEILHHCCCCCW